MKLLPVGISNRLFYYMNAGEDAAFDIRFHVDLREKLDREALSAAAEKAIHNFPEFAIRPVIHDNAVWAVPNRAEIPLMEDAAQGKGLHYGTGETGGYLFAICCREDGFSFSCFHGMADFYGMWHFIRTLFYYYALEKGLDVCPDEFVRTDANQWMAEDETESLDPYLKFASLDKAGAAERQEAFEIPENYYDWGIPYNVGYEIRCPLKLFLQTVRQYRSSVSSFLSLLTARSIMDAYGGDGKPIRVMVPANMRKYYNVRTMVNFSDATFLSYDGELAALPVEEQAVRLREMLKDQMTREHFDPLIARKVQLVQGFFDAGIPIAEWNRRFSQPPREGDGTFMTAALTYPGSLDLPAEYQSMVREITRWIYIRGANIFGLHVTTYGDTVCIRSCQRFDSDAILKGICSGLSQVGLPTHMTVLERYRGNQILPDRLQQV